MTTVTKTTKPTKPKEEADDNFYTKEEMDSVITQIKCKFAEWKGCELKKIRYAGDECTAEENIAWLNTFGDTKYVKAIEFLMDFHTPKEQTGAWEADEEYTDYEWWLARSEDGGWEVVTQGYG